MKGLLDLDDLIDGEKPSFLGEGDIPRAPSRGEGDIPRHTLGDPTLDEGDPKLLALEGRE